MSDRQRWSNNSKKIKKERNGKRERKRKSTREIMFEIWRLGQRKMKKKESNSD